MQNAVKIINKKLNDASFRTKKKENQSEAEKITQHEKARLTKHKCRFLKKEKVNVR